MVPPQSTNAPTTPDMIPPLESGDHLTREEFERRYEAMPNTRKAELIEGVVHMPSPVRLTRHGNPHFRLTTLLGLYEAMTPGVLGGDNATARLDVINEPQPDVMLLILPECGGQARISADDYVEHAPELVAEVSASTVSIDLHNKLEVYRRCGVREYLVWRVEDRVIDWFVLRGEQYQRIEPDAEGISRSEIFPGLWLDSAALVREDTMRVMDVSRQGTTSPEHAAFVQRLRAARQGE